MVIQLKIEDLIMNENDENKLFLYSIFLYQKKILISPFSSDHEKKSFLIAFHSLFNIFDIKDLLEYKKKLVVIFNQAIKNKIISNDTLTIDVKQFIGVKLKEYHMLNHVEYCFFSWLFVCDTIEKISTNNFLAAKKYDLFYIKIRDIFLSCRGDFHSARKYILIFLYEDGVFESIDLFNFSNKKEEGALVARWSFIINNNCFNIDSCLDIVGIDWIINFVSNYLSKRNCNISSSIEQQCYTAEGKIDAVKAIINYYIFQNIDTTKLFNQSIKKAIAQRKYRGSEKKKTLNIQISNETKNKLNDLLHHHNKTQPKFIEMLINEAYYKILPKK